MAQNTTFWEGGGGVGEEGKECLVFFKWTKGIRNSRNFHPGRSERLACFEKQPSSEVLHLYFIFKKITFLNGILCICKYFILDEGIVS